MLAIIGGTGFGSLAGLEGSRIEVVNTRFGEAELETGELAGRPVIFLPRHGHPPRNPPHRINYRANITALIEAGVTAVIAVTAVGTVDELLTVPTLVIPDQIIDYTWGREHSLFEDIEHIDFTFPYDTSLRSTLIAAARAADRDGIELVEQGVYGCTQGPRLETAAEIRRMRRDGCSIVGMTAMPEASLAREAGLPYAGISVTVNAGAGINDQAIALEEIEAVMTQGMDVVAAIVNAVSGSYSAPGAAGA